MITFASLFSKRSATAFSINASNKGPTIAPIFKIPKKAKYNSGVLDIKINTLSPFLTSASFFNTLAALFEYFFISSNVYDS